MAINSEVSDLNIRQAKVQARLDDLSMLFDDRDFSVWLESSDHEDVSPWIQRACE